MRRVWVTRDGNIDCYNFYFKKPTKKDWNGFAEVWTDGDVFFDPDYAKRMGLKLPPGGGPRAAVILWEDEWEFKE